MDRLEAMSFLVAAVETGSFSAASRKLNVPLPTVSRKIAELEEHLQARLLVRSTRKLTLTEAGTAYLEHCRPILEQVNEAERAASGEYVKPRGELVVSAPIVFGRLHLLPIINEFLATYPEIKVRLMLTDKVMHLVDDHVDVALRMGELPDSRIVAAPVGTVCHMVCGSPDYFKAHGVPDTPADLAEHDCINCEPVSPGSLWPLSALELKPAPPTPVQARLSVSTAEAAIDSAIAGVGLTSILSYQVARAVELGQLQLTLRAYEPKPIPVNLIHLGQKPLPLKTKIFVEFVVPRLRAVLLHDKDRLRCGTMPGTNPPNKAPIESIDEALRKASAGSPAARIKQALVD